MIYSCQWIPISHFCLPLTQFTTEQCNEYMKLTRQTFLPRLGWNRHAPLVVIHGPTLLGGNDRVHVETEQLIQHIKFFMGYMRQDTPNGRLYRILLEVYQLIMGVGFHILENTSKDLPHSEPNMIEYIRRQAQSLNITFKITGAWKPPLVREGDRNIMEDMIALHLRPEYLRMMNNCRLYLQIVTLADITDPTGAKIEEWAWNGIRERSSTLSWPRQERPSEKVWIWWRRHIRRLYIVRTNEL